MRARLTVFLARKTDTLDIAALFLVTAAAAAYLLFAGAPVARASLAVEALALAQVVLFAWTFAAALRVVTRTRLDAGAYPVGAAVVLAVLALDRLHFVVVREHLSLGVVRAFLSAIHTGAIPIDSGSLALATVLAAVVAATLFVGMKVFSLVPRPAGLASAVRRRALPLVLVIGSVGSLRDCLLASSPDLADVRAAVPWDDPISQSSRSPDDAKGREGQLWGEARVFSELRARREELLSAQLRASSRPDILIIHIEGLRGDMLRAEVAPFLTSFSAECTSTPHHYTTGTNTGTGVFGILNGLTAPYYPLARQEHAQPIPLQILKKLGYSLSTFFISNLKAYDGLADLYFKGLADFTYEGPEQPVYEADSKMVDAYVERLRTVPGDAPRFDYLVLDSTHYDYSYPPSFEKFTPEMTLGVGIRDGMIRRAGINDELKWKGPFIRNRYQNSVLYADSLVARILLALRASGRFERSIVVITGDHGEAFWEHDTFGHGLLNLAEEQTRVAFVMHLPTHFASGYRYSSHADIFPTIFDSMGLDTAVPFMNGKSLLRYESSLDDAVVGYGVTGESFDLRLAVVGDGLKVYWRNAVPFEVTEVLSDDDGPLAPPPAERANDLVLQALAQKALRRLPRIR